MTKLPGCKSVIERSDTGVSRAVFDTDPCFLNKLKEFSLCLFSILRYKNSLMFVVRPFPECLQTDDIRLVPKMDELLHYTKMMEKVLLENEISYTVIDVLDLKKRADIVKEKILEYKGLKVTTRTDRDILNRDD